MTSPFRLLDEKSRPPLREELSRVLQDAESADFAVHRIRLAALDLDDRELEGVREWRVLVGRLDASMLLDVPHESSRHLRRLGVFADSGRLHVRSVGLAGWAPDFAVVRGATTTSFLGSLYFGQPHLVTGPAFTLVTSEGGAARLLTRRFDELWAAAHDVLPAVQRVLRRVNGNGVQQPG